MGTAMAINKTYNVIVVGYKGQGKSATVTKLSGDPNYRGKEDEVARKTFKLNKPGSCTVKVVDTPGLGSLTANNRMTLDIIHNAAWRMERVDAILIVFKTGRITYTRMEVVNQFRRIFGDNFLKKSIIVLTFADVMKQKNTSIGEFIANSPEPFQNLLKACGERIWCVENRDWEDREETQGELLELIKSVETVPFEVPGVVRVNYWHLFIKFVFQTLCCGEKNVCIAVIVAIVVAVVITVVTFGVTNS